jgi:dTDP-D-glucose 4,6-dehydratase
MTNLDLCKYLIKKFGYEDPSGYMEYTEDRAINDLRYYRVSHPILSLIVSYFISDEKLRAMGWSQKVSFEEGIAKTSMFISFQLQI